MTLQTSGTISLNDIHVEAGGTSGTTASSNDVDIRGLIGKLPFVSQSFSDYYGASAGTVVTVTQGTKSQTMATLYGYSNSDSFGSVSPTTVDGDTLNSLSILNVYRVSSSGGLFFTIDVSYSSANAIAADEFTKFIMVCDGVTITVTTAEAQTSTLGGGYIRRWTWSSYYGLNSTEISKITTEWDGSGDIDVTFKP